MDSCQCLFLLLAVIAALAASSEGVVTKCWQCTNAVSNADCQINGHWQFCTQQDAVCEIVTSTYNTGTTYNRRCVSRSRCGSCRFPVLPTLPQQDADYNRPRVSEIQRKYAVKPDLKKPIKPTMKRYLIKCCVKCVPAVVVKPIVLKVTCDDRVSVYIDGQATPIVQNYNWQQVSSVQIPGNTKVVAIQCRDKARVKVGIIASLSNGVVTDNSWQCSGTLQAGWAGTPFTPNPAWWASATIIPNIAAWGNFAQNGGISSSAKWIWTSQYSYPGWDTPVYCRKQLY
eukprot:GHVU01004102.1.p1 GENE.GHVU01004102.1~~GHVU01004102.1.p1  ORF type:complete len:285 (+),score=9.68 GHVU01004102.1:113-967(+)